MLKTRFPIVVVVLALVVGALFYLPKRTNINSGDDIAVSLPSAQSSESVMRSIPDGWREYRNEQYRFSLLYPEGMRVKEFDEGTGASTITFEKGDKGLGFQIFMVPYNLPQVTEERFRQDVPLGIRENSSNLQIGGVLASSFDSDSFGLGQTREIWFIHGGFLFEVTTFRIQGVWLSEIMGTWTFL